MQPGSWSLCSFPQLPMTTPGARISSLKLPWWLPNSPSGVYEDPSPTPFPHHGWKDLYKTVVRVRPPPPPPGIFQLPVALCLKMRRSTYPDPANIFLLPLCAPASEPLLCSGKKLTWAFPSSYLVNSVLLVPRIWHFLTSLMRWNPLLQATKCKELLCLLRVLIE